MADTEGSVNREEVLDTIILYRQRKYSKQEVIDRVVELTGLWPEVAWMYIKSMCNLPASQVRGYNKSTSGSGKPARKKGG